LRENCAAALSRLGGKPRQRASANRAAAGLTSREMDVMLLVAKGNTSRQTLIPQTQHYLVYVDILDPDAAITPGSMAQVKIHCRPETVASWVWRKINDMFNLGLL